MSDVTQVPDAPQVSAGKLLGRAREAADLNVASLAVALKVPARKLEALEQDRYADVGDAVFIRALASSVCRTLKVDPQPVLDRLPQTPARVLKDDPGLNTPFRSAKDAATPTWAVKLRQPVPLTVTVLLAGALAVALLPVPHREGAAAPAAQTPAAGDAAATAASPSPLAQATSAPAPAASETAPAVPAAAAPAIAAAAEPAPGKPAAADSGASAAPVAAAAASGIVVFRTKGPSWVEVTDAKGAFPLRRLMAAGESAGVSGALPLKVTIGKVDTVEVQVRGKPFDLKPVSRDNVARFQVK